MQPPPCDTDAAVSESRHPKGKISEVEPRSLKEVSRVTRPRPQLLDLARRLRHRRTSEPRRTVRPRRRKTARMDVYDPVVARDGRRARRHPRPRRRLRAAAGAGDRRRDHGCREVRLPRMARGPGMEGVVGSRSAVPHTPVFVLTHHPRPSIEMEGGTTFHFLDVSPAEALETAREAADGQDLRIGGGATVIRDFLAAGLVDHMHIVVVPILLGRGARLWEGLEGLEKDYQVEAACSPSGVTHVSFTHVA